VQSRSGLHAFGALVLSVRGTQGWRRYAALLMAEEQRDPRGDRRAPDEEQAADGPMADAYEKSRHEARAGDSPEAKTAGRTRRFDTAGLTGLPIIPPDLLPVVGKHQEERWKAIRSSLLASKVLGGALRAAIPPHFFRVVDKHQEERWKSINSNLRASNALLDTFRPTIPRVVFRGLRESQEAVRRLAAGLTEQLRVGAPPNWQFGDDWPRLSAIADVVEGDGIPLAWVPRGDIVLALVHAEEIEARRGILADLEADVLQDCSSCLDDTDCVELAELVENAREAVGTFEAGYPRAAQALATVVLDAALRRLFADPDFSYGSVRRQLADVWGNAPLREMRSALVLAAIPGALERFWVHRGDPVPVRFNRHASAHTLHAAQYTRTNALVAIMTITSLLRETQESGWYDPDAEQSAS
jgi:hypothetical protein